MASNRPAPEAPFVPSQRDGESQTFGYGSYNSDDEGPWQEWNPTEETIRPVRGRHRVAKQRGGLARGGLARSSTVLGVGVIAAVGGAGMASAQSGKPRSPYRCPTCRMSARSSQDEARGRRSPQASTSRAQQRRPDRRRHRAGHGRRRRGAARPHHGAGRAAAGAGRGKAAAEAAQTAAAEKAAAAGRQGEEGGRGQGRRREEEGGRGSRAAEGRGRAPRRARQAVHAADLLVHDHLHLRPGRPLWSSGYHTGLDFAAPTGTLIKAVHSGTITQAGWSGSYGYKTVLTLDDGTEIWYAHQSSIGVSVGQKVATGDVIGRVGATGNVTGAHLHMEVHPGGSASGIDPVAWLRSKGLTP